MLGQFDEAHAAIHISGCEGHDHGEVDANKFLNHVKSENLSPFGDLDEIGSWYPLAFDDEPPEDPDLNERLEFLSTAGGFVDGTGLTNLQVGDTTEKCWSMPSGLLRVVGF